MKWNAYHFVGDTLRDGRPVPPDGETLVHDGLLVLCPTLIQVAYGMGGFHFCRHPFDALQYAPGATLCRVHVGGDVLEPDDEDKGVCTERTIIRRIDATNLLRKFARDCALDVIHLWDAPDVVQEYLETGDDALKNAARAAARAAARDAAWDAARGAARDAAWYAVSDAAWDAARAAAWGAARVAAWDAARDAALAAEDAAWAAEAAARDAQRERFESAVNAAFEEARQ